MSLLLTWLWTASAHAECLSVESLEQQHQAVADSQRTPGAKDLSKKVAKQMLTAQKKGELCEPDASFWAAMNLLLAREAMYAERCRRAAAGLQAMWRRRAVRLGVEIDFKVTWSPRRRRLDVVFMIT